MFSRSFAARSETKVAGAFILSGGLIGETLSFTDYKPFSTPCTFFLGCSDIDPHIPLDRVSETEHYLTELGASAEVRIYKGMGHTINSDEIARINQILVNNNKITT